MTNTLHHVGCGVNDIIANIFGSSLPVQKHRAAMAYCAARARNAALLVSAGSSDVAQVIFEFCKLLFVMAVTDWKYERPRRR
jgi:hypothetical protein